MEATAKVSFVRITPRKIGLIADAVRGKKVEDAISYLKFSPRKRTASVVKTLIESAVANAGQKGSVNTDRLVVKTILVGPGAILKRFRPRAKGSAFRINKRTSNVSVVVSDR